MGKNDNQSITGQEKGGTDGTSTIKSTGSTSSSNPGRGRPRGTTGTRKSIEKGMEIPNVDSPKIVAIEIPTGEEKPAEEKKGRGRPAGTTKKKAAAKKPTQADHTHLKILLITVTGVIAARPNMSMFALTEEESEQIAKPLANIMAKNESVSAITNEYADHIALLFAVGTIFIGKYMAYRLMNPKPQKKELKVNGKSVKERQINPSHTGDDSKPTNPGPPKTNGNTFNGDLNHLLNPIGGI